MEWASVSVRYLLRIAMLSLKMLVNFLKIALAGNAMPIKKYCSNYEGHAAYGRLGSTRYCWRRSCFKTFDECEGRVNFIALWQGGFLDYYVCDILGFGIEVGFRLLVSWNGQAWGLVGALHAKRHCCVTIFEVWRYLVCQFSARSLRLL